MLMLPHAVFLLGLTAAEPDAAAESIVELKAGEVELRGARWKSLQSDDPRPPGPMILRRDVRLTAVPGGVEVEARWTLRAVAAGWFANQVLGADARVHRATWNGRRAALWSSSAGRLVVQRVEGDGELVVHAFVPGDPAAGLDLALMGAPRGTVRLTGFEPETRLEGNAGPVVEHRAALSTGAARLRLQPRSGRDDAAREQRVIARVGLGMTAGALDEVSLVARGLGDDLVVEGPQLSRWRRDGDRVIVALKAAARGSVELDLRWSVATPGGAEARIELPVLLPQDVFRTRTAVQLARDGAVDVRPALARWSPIAAAQLPVWAQGLVEGTPTASFRRSGARADAPDHLDLLRLVPVPGPPMVVDIADLQLAASEGGGLLLRARYEVRNERASHLVLRPPPGMSLVGVVVAGREVRAALDGDVLRIPLKRSIETVQGPLRIPVTVALLGEGPAWARHERRELPLPAVNAPVAVGRVSLYLPPRYRPRLTPGKAGVVERFSQGDEVAYGLEDDPRAARADALLAEAIDAWNDNDFAGAQAKLDALVALGVADTNTAGLQANVDLVAPRPAAAVVESGSREADIAKEADVASERPMHRRPAASPAASSAVARRIRARLRARSTRTKAEFKRKKRKARAYKDAGEYEAAAAEYRQALETSRELDRLEDEESVEYDFAADEIEGELEALEPYIDQTPAEEAPAEEAPAEEAPAEPAGEGEGEYDRVSGAWRALAGRWPGLWGMRAQLEPAAGPESSPGEPPLRISEPGLPSTRADQPLPVTERPVVTIPRVGVAVRYEHLLLEAGEVRTIPIDARRTRSRR